MKMFGGDFTSAPCRRKAITVAAGRLKGMTLGIEGIERLETFSAVEALLARPGPWIGGLDFPFGLRAELCRDLGWPLEWKGLVSHCSGLTRQQLRCALDAYRNSRPDGRKYAHRKTDMPAGSSSPMKLVNPPVALMFHEGAPRLADAGVHIPGLADGDHSRVALEAYPGLLARSILGRVSYKNDSIAKQTPERRKARARIVAALSIKIENKLKKQLLNDASGDSLDAVLCAIQAAKATAKRGYGIPKDVFGCEGWIVTA